MKKATLFYILILILPVIISGCGGGPAGGEKEPNNSIDKANTITLEEPFPISINPVGDMDWCKVELPEQGYLKVQASEVPEEIVPEVSFALYNEWEGEKENILRGWNQLPDAVFIPRKDTYYFVIKDDYDDAASKKPIQIIATFIKEFDSLEPNNSPEEAAEISTGSVIKPAIFPRDDQDWLKVTVEEQGYLVIQSKNVPEAIVPEVLFGIYDEWAGPEIKELRSWHRVPDACFIPGPGDYLIQLQDDYNDKSAETNFDLKIDFLEEMDDSEPNNDFNDAKEINRGDTIRAAIFPTEDNDYYKINTGESGSLKLSAKDFSDIVPEVILFTKNEVNPDSLDEASEWKVLPAEYEVEKNTEYFILLHDDYDDQSSPEPFQFHVE